MNDCKRLTVFTKRLILDVWQGSEYASVVRSSVALWILSRFLNMFYITDMQELSENILTNVNPYFQ